MGTYKVQNRGKWFSSTIVVAEKPLGSWSQICPAGNEQFEEEEMLYYDEQADPGVLST
jgi:hypothetical protein